MCVCDRTWNRRRSIPSPNTYSQAPPGAGKTSIIPLALLKHNPAWLLRASTGGKKRKKIVVLEPRIVAAK